ncbi:MAG: hypothetical protein GX861_03065 [Tenericutes bacterium]|nr:hypothetical protein [Mycoplasmatota bacterium]
MFKEACILTILIIIHELGHFLVAFIFRWPISSINLYPYGGLIKFNAGFNKPIKEEIIITLMGSVAQIIFFQCLVWWKVRDIELIKSYHYGILFFNLLPIYPLDGGKLIHLFISYFLSFKKSFRAIFCLSYVYIFFLLIYLYLNFILERYLYGHNLKKRAIINNVDQFYRDKVHVIKHHDHYHTERDILCEKFVKS